MRKNIFCSWSFLSHDNKWIWTGVLLGGWLFWVVDGITAMDIITEIEAVGKLSKRKLSVISDLPFLGISWFGVTDLENGLGNGSERKHLFLWNILYILEQKLYLVPEENWGLLLGPPNQKEGRKLVLLFHSTFNKMCLALVFVYLKAKMDQGCLLFPEVLPLSRASWSNVCGPAWEEEEERVILVLFWNTSPLCSTPSCFLQLLS